ncbi:MAG: DNA polymerase IV [Verrucomicrobia bacterium]|nr:DNA polymerase IV [Verrucomicrobiota bacterium]
MIGGDRVYGSEAVDCAFGCGCFFASVEQAADPRLRGKPVAVGGESRGVIAAASYEARQYGVFTTMPTARARRLCPQLIVLPGDYEKYEQFSRWMFSYVYDFTPEVEITSVDEGYFDVTGYRRFSAREVAEKVRGAIGQSLKIQVSEGIATNKLVSQIASKLNKPRSFTEVPAGWEKRFIHPLPAKWLPGIGEKTVPRFMAAGMSLIRHVSEVPLELLEMVAGSQAPVLKRYAEGVDDRPVVAASAPAKSYSHQETFREDIIDEAYALAVLKRMADSLMAKIRSENRSIRCVAVRVRYNDMGEDQCSATLNEPTDLETDLYGRIDTLLRKAWRRRVSLRLVGLRLSQVYDGYCRTTLPFGGWLGGCGSQEAPGIGRGRSSGDYWKIRCCAWA